MGFSVASHNPQGNIIIGRCCSIANTPAPPCAVALAGWLAAGVGAAGFKTKRTFFYTHTPKEAHTRVGAGGGSVYVANDSRAGAQLGIRTRIWTRGGRGRGEGECPITVIIEPASDPETSR